MPSNVKVGIHISAVDNTQRAVASVRRNFAQMQRQFASVNKLGNIGNMGNQFRRVRREIMATAGVSRRFISGTGLGAELIANRALPSLQKSLKQTAKVNKDVSRNFADNWNSIGGVFSNAYITGFLLFRAIQGISGYMARATIDNEKYIKTLKVLEGSMERAQMRMKQMHEIARLPSIQAPEAAQSFIKLRSVGLTSTFSTDIIEEFSNAMAIAGGTSRDLSESIRQLGQMMSTGKIDMENFRVIIERMPTIRTAVMKTFGPGAIHTDVLQQVLNKEQLSAEDAWQRIFDVMQYEQRADPNTLANRIESLQDAIWELSSNLGELYTPTFKKGLDGITKIIDGFNNLNKPVHEFIGWMGTTTALISGLGITMFAISKMFKVVKEPFGRAFNFFKGFHDRDIYKPDGRAERRFGERPTVKYGDLTREHRKRRSIFATQEEKAKGTLSQEMRGYAEKTDQDLEVFKDELQRRKGKFKAAYAKNEKLMREQVDRELLNSTLMEQEMTRKAEATAHYDSRLEDIASKIQTEQTKIARHTENLTKSEIDLLDQYNKHFVKSQKLQKEFFTMMTTGDYDPVKGDRISKETELHEQNMRRLKNQLKSPLGSAGEIFRLQRELTDLQSNQIRVFQETGNKLFKQEARKHIGKYKKNQIDALISAAQQELGDDVSIDRIKQIYADDISKIENLTIDDLPKRYKDTIRQRIKPQIDESMKEINDVVKQTQADLNSALDKGNMGRLKSLHKELDNLIDGYDEFERNYTEATAELDRKIAEDNVRRASGVNEQGKRVFHDPDTENKIIEGQRKFARQWNDNTRHLKKQVAQTDTLRKRAWANFKSIDHLDNLVELAYGAGIGLAIAGITVGVTALVNHFENLKTATEEYAQLLRDKLPDFIEFRDLYLDWGAKTTRILRTGVEPIGAEMALAFKRERHYLTQLKKERPDVFFEFQEERLKHINRVLKDKGFELDEYRREYWKLEQERQLKLLADPRFQSEGVENFEKQLPKLRKELNELDTAFFKSNKRISDLLSGEQLDALSKIIKDHGDLVVKPEKWWQAPEIFLANSQIEAETQNIIRNLLKDYEVLEKTNTGHAEALTRSVRKYVELRNTIKSLEFDFDAFTKQIDRVNRAFAEARKELQELSIDLKDVGDWEFPRSGAEERIEEIRNTFFHHHVEMQKLVSNEKSHLEQIVKLEETANDRLKKSNETRQKIYDKYQIYRWVQENRKRLTEIVAKAGSQDSKLGILDVIGEIGPGEVTQDHKRILESVGQKPIKNLLKEVTRVSISQTFDELAEASKDAQDQAKKTGKQIADSEREFLSNLRESFQTRLLDDSQITPQFEVGQLTRYLATLKEIHNTVKDVHDKDKFSESIRQVEKNLKAASEQGDVWRKNLELIEKQQQKVGDTQHQTGFSPERLDDVSRTYSQSQTHESRTLSVLLEGLTFVSDLVPKINKYLGATDDILNKIRYSAKFVIDNTQKWADEVSKINTKIDVLQDTFYSRSEGIQKIVEDEIQLLKRLKELIPDDEDIIKFSTTIGKMQDISSEMNNYATKIDVVKKQMERFKTSVVDQISKQEKTFVDDLVNRLPEGSELRKVQSEIAEIYNAVHTGKLQGIEEQNATEIENLIKKYQVALDKESQLLTEYDRKILGDGLRLIESSLEGYKKLGGLRLELRNLKDELTDFMDSPDALEAVQQFLKGVRSSIAEANDLPVRIHKAQQELANLQMKTVEPGGRAQRTEDIFNAKEELRVLQEQVDTQKHAKGVFETYISLFPEQLKWMRFTREELQKTNAENKKMIDFYNEMESLRIGDTIHRVFSEMIEWQKEVPKVSRIIDKIRNIGKGVALGANNAYFPSVFGDIEKALNDIELQEKEIARFFREDSVGRQAFKDEFVKRLRAEGIEPSFINQVMSDLEQQRQVDLKKANRELEQQMQWFLDNRSKILSNAVRRESRAHIKEFARSLVDRPLEFGFDELWSQHVTKPLQDERTLEDIHERTRKSIEEINNSTRAGFRAGLSDQVLSARQRRKELLDIRRSETDQIQEIEERQAKEHKRLWEDRKNDVRKYFAEFAKEQLKIRLLSPLVEKGIGLLDIGLDKIGLDKLIPIPDKPHTEDEASWWNSRKSYLANYVDEITDKYAKHFDKVNQQTKEMSKAQQSATTASKYLAEAAKWAAQELLNCTCVSDLDNIKPQPKGPDPVKDGLNTTNFDVDPSSVVDWFSNAISQMFSGGFSVSADTGLRRGTVTIGELESLGKPEKIPTEATHDHPRNDRKMREMGWQQASAYNKRMGFRTAQHMEEEFESGYEKRLKQFESQKSNSSTGKSSTSDTSKELKDIRDAVVELQEITSEVADRPIQVNIGDNKVRKIDHKDEKMVRQNRTRMRKR